MVESFDAVLMVSSGMFYSINTNDCTFGYFPEEPQAWQLLVCEPADPRQRQYVTKISIGYRKNVPFSLPFEITELSKLTSIEIFQNDALTGTLSPWLGGTLSNLRFLHIYDNMQLSGTVPDTYKDFMMLEELRLRQVCPYRDPTVATKLQGTCINDPGLLSGTLPPLGNLPNLRLISLEGTQIAGGPVGSYPPQIEVNGCDISYIPQGLYWGPAWTECSAAEWFSSIKPGHNNTMPGWVPPNPLPDYSGDGLCNAKAQFCVDDCDCPHDLRCVDCNAVLGAGHLEGNMCASPRAADGPKQVCPCGPPDFPAGGIYVNPGNCNGPNQPGATCVPECAPDYCNPMGDYCSPYGNPITCTTSGGQWTEPSGCRYRYQYTGTAPTGPPNPQDPEFLEHVEEIIENFEEVCVDNRKSAKKAKKAAKKRIKAQRMDKKRSKKNKRLGPRKERNSKGSGRR